MPLIISLAPIAAVPVLIFQEIRPLLRVMPLAEKRINPHFPLGDAAPAHKHPVNLFFRDKAAFRRREALHGVKLPRLYVKVSKSV